MATGIRPGFPVAGDGYWAEVEAHAERLRLFAEVYSLGFLAVVYDVNRDQKLSPEDANNLDDAKSESRSQGGWLFAVPWGRNFTSSPLDTQRQKSGGATLMV